MISCYITCLFAITYMQYDGLIACKYLARFMVSLVQFRGQFGANMVSVGESV